MRVLTFSVGLALSRFTSGVGVLVGWSRSDSTDMPGKSPTSWTGGMVG